MKLEINFDEKQKSYIYWHTLIIVCLLGAWAVFAGIFWNSDEIFAGVFIVAIGVTLFSLADYLNLIEFRKTADRKTKCVLCGRVKKHEDHILKNITETEREGKNSVNERKKEFEHEPGMKLTGIVVDGKVLCTDCINLVKEMVK